jgi:diguanylate cyclase (GGDEF)-like protein
MDTTFWIALGALGLAGICLAAVVAVILRWRRASTGQIEEVKSSSVRTEAMFSDLVRSLDNARREEQRARLLGEIGASIELDTVLQRSLEALARLTGTDATMIVLAQGDDDPVVASYGLAAEESSATLLGTPPEGARARAATIRYRYSEEAVAGDEFRVCGGLVVPLVGEAGDRVGQLAVFWRRADRDVSENELARFEEIAAVFGPALENARRFREAREASDLDPVTKLHNRRYFDEALARECVRARRYEHGLALVVFRVEGETGDERLAVVAERVRPAVRRSDILCHLGEGMFAALMPEAGLDDAEKLSRRLQFAAGARVGAEEDHLRLVAGIAELGPGDDPGSVFGRARAPLEETAEQRTTAPAEASGSQA